METHDNLNSKKPGQRPIKKTRNKELTKLNLIQAVGEINRREGYPGLKINKIAQQAMVSKKLIYDNFRTVEELIDQYIKKKDYWMLLTSGMDERASDEDSDLAAEISGILERQFDFFFSEIEMQQLLLWELSGSNLMRKVSVERENLGEKFLKLTDAYFEGSDINFRALGALLSSGIYYLVLHAHVTTFCGIDLNKPEDRNAIKETIRGIINFAFEHGKAGNASRRAG